MGRRFDWLRCQVGDVLARLAGTVRRVQIALVECAVNRLAARRLEAWRRGERNEAIDDKYDYGVALLNRLRYGTRK
jgi:hypothetical protein